MGKFVAESWLIVVLAVVFAGLLAGAQTTLSARIHVNQDKALNEAIAVVVPHTATTEKVPIDAKVYDRDVYKCLDTDGRLAGWAIDASGVGFADRVRAVVGLSPDLATITGMKVIENVETPGLGNKIADDTEDPDDFRDRFTDLSAVKPVVVEKGKADRAKNEVQAITGATISSKAVRDIVNVAIERVRPALATSATTTTVISPAAPATGTAME